MPHRVGATRRLIRRRVLLKPDRFRRRIVHDGESGTILELDDGPHFQDGEGTPSSKHSRCSGMSPLTAWDPASYARKSLRIFDVSASTSLADVCGREDQTVASRWMPNTSKNAQRLFAR